MNALKIVRRNWLVYWRSRRSSLLLSVLTPVMFLSAMGLGLGSLVQERQAFGGVDYTAFFATGIFAASCMQTGFFSATYPIMSKITWQRNYEAMVASPLSPRDIFLGELSWIGVVLTQLALPFLAVMAVFGLVGAGAVLALPVVILLGLACAAPTFAFTATQQTDDAYTWMFRFIVTPLFLLSGTFFPIDQLPSWGQALAHLTPLFHGVELVRQLALYDLEVSALWHLSYLLVMLGLGVAIGIRNLERRLLP
ncbi:MAG: ABC transporter permease [Actinomycetota bacterium]|nr:ABC transporter permease [Actinomycetota bacterium]